MSLVVEVVFLGGEGLPNFDWDAVAEAEAESCSNIRLASLTFGESLTPKPLLLVVMVAEEMVTLEFSATATAGLSLSFETFDLEAFFPKLPSLCG